MTVGDRVFRMYGRVMMGKDCVVDDDAIIGYPPRDVLLSKGKKHLLSTKIGNRCIVRSGCVIYATATLEVGVQLGHHVVVREGAEIGAESRIGCFTEIAPDAVIGERCRITGRAYIANGVKFGKGIFVGPGLLTANRRFTTAFLDGKEDHELMEPPVVEDGALIGTNVTLNPGVRVGMGSVVGSGCLVTKNVPAGSIVAGMPGRFIGPVSERLRRGKR